MSETEIDVDATAVYRVSCDECEFEAGKSDLGEALVIGHKHEGHYGSDHRTTTRSQEIHQ